MMKIDREEFIRVLESVSPGLAASDRIEQSSCFVFCDGFVYTFNDEILCRRKSGLDESVSGAVRADKMILQLGKWLDDELEVTVRDKALVFSARRREAGFLMDAEILLDINSVPPPEKWDEIPEDFAEAISVVQQCASTDYTSALGNVHIHKDWVEACDNFQACRWPLSTGLKKSVLVRGDSIKHVARMGVSHWALSDGWISFRASTGLELCCRRYVEDYLDLTEAFEGEGVAASLPKGLVEACDKASVFSDENTDMKNVQVDLSPGKIHIRGNGLSGWYSETKKLEYSGPSISFCAAPKVLSDLVKRNTDAVIAKNKMIVSSGSYRYVLHLFVVEESAKDHHRGAEEESTPKKTRKKRAVAEEVVSDDS